MTETLLAEGLTIMCIGVSVVLTFLCVLILAMNIMSKVVGYLNKIFPEQIIVSDKPSKSRVVSDDEAVAVALAVIRARG